MGALILSGGGSAEQNMKAHASFAEKLGHGKAVLYIPVAGDPERRSHEESFLYIKKCLKPHGISQLEMWTDLNGKSFVDLQMFAGVYISGGCSLKLLRWMRESGFDRLLLEFYRREGVIFGQSAGAIIFGSRLPSDLCEDGLNLLEDWMVWCHYKPRDHEEISRLMVDGCNPVLAMGDGGAVIVHNGRRKTISGDVYYWRP